MKPITVLSLFDGMSCGQIALERAGIPVKHYLASEIDPHAIKITQKNYPGTRQLGNVVDLKPKHSGGIDLLIGGSPCQGFSRAGKQLNFDDPRSKLFFEFARLLKECQPRYFLLENVKMRNEWKEIISEYLGVEPIEINSKLVSGQHRTRLYWTNIPGVQHPIDRGILLNDILESVPVGKDYVYSEGIWFDPTISEASRSLVKKVDNEIRISQTVKKGYIVAHEGDGVNLSFPTSKSRRGRAIRQKSSTIDCVCNIGVLTDGVIRRLTITELERLQTLPDGYTDCVDISKRKKAIGNGWTVDVIAHIFSYLRGVL